jgi:ribosomal protein L44E
MKRVEERLEGWIVQGRRLQEEAVAQSVGDTRRHVRSTLRRVKLMSQCVQCRQQIARCQWRVEKPVVTVEWCV